MESSFAKQCGIQYPLIQAPMLGVTTPAMVAAVAHAGGLGALPIGGLPPAKAAELIRETKAKTSKPFSVNLFAHDVTPSVSEDELSHMQDFLESIARAFSAPFERKTIPDFRFYGYEEHIDLLLEEEIPIVSFTFGTLRPEVVNALKNRGSLLVGTATCLEEAKILAGQGIDVVVVQGFEAGGHRGTFLADIALPQVGLMSLLPQIVDALDVPVIAAGGLFDARTIRAAMSLGAVAAQVGSAFVLADESLASDAYKQAILDSTDTSTELTRAFSGRWARGIRNTFMERMDDSGLSIPYYTYQNNLTASLRAYGQANNIAGLGSLWAGQSAYRGKRGTSEDIFLSLIRELKWDELNE